MHAGSPRNQLSPPAWTLALLLFVATQGCGPGDSAGVCDPSGQAPNFAPFAWASGDWRGTSESGDNYLLSIDSIGAPTRLDWIGVDAIQPRKFDVAFGCAELDDFPLVFDDPNYQDCQSALSCGNSWENRLIGASVTSQTLTLTYSGGGENQELSLIRISDDSLEVTWSFVQGDGRETQVKGVFARVVP